MSTQDPAVVNVGVLNHFALNYIPAALDKIRETRIRIMLGGVLSSSRVRLATFGIHTVADDEPDTCNLSVDAAPWPTVGQDVRVTINSNTPRYLFNGAIQSIDVTYDGDRPKRQVVHAHAVDDLAALDRLPIGVWANVSASTVAAQLLAGFAPGFTGVNIAPGLPAISIILDGSEGGWPNVLRQIAGLIGGAFYIEDRDLHLFIEEVTEPPDPLTGPDPLAHDPAITQTVDDSQLRTRVFGRGHGEPLLSDVLAGETILPVDNAGSWFSAGGGAATTDDGQRLTYTGVQVGGSGAVAGPSAAPSAAPNLTPTGGSVESGVHQYAYLFGTASGKSLPSPIASITTDTTTLPIPTQAPFVVDDPGSGGALVAGQVYRWRFTYSIDDTHETPPGPVSGPFTGTGHTGGLLHATPITGVPGDTRVNFYRTTGNGSTYYLEMYTTVVNWNANPDSQYIVGVTTDAQLLTRPTPPVTNTANRGGAVVNGIALGPAGTTYREVYRTIAAGSQLRLLTTIANNTSTGPYTDTAADATLGASAPSTDTSGLSTTAGQINAGSTSMLLASAAAFAAGGGWTMNGIRYGGISGNTLIGIPPSGVGAILTTIPYGTAIVAAPALVGVAPPLVRPLTRGTTITIFVQRDDGAAQAEAAARETTAVRVSDGIHEYMVTDERRNANSLTALCNAYLALFARPIVTVGYATRDVKTKAGKTITVNLTVPPINQELLIQEVTISEIDIAPGTPPKYTVVASSIRYSLESMLRRLSGLLET